MSSGRVVSVWMQDEDLGKITEIKNLLQSRGRLPPGFRISDSEIIRIAIDFYYYSLMENKN